MFRQQNQLLIFEILRQKSFAKIEHLFFTNPRGLSLSCDSLSSLWTKFPLQPNSPLSSRALVGCCATMQFAAQLSHMTTFLPSLVRSFGKEIVHRSELVERNPHKSPNRIFAVIVFMFSFYFLSLIVKLVCSLLNLFSIENCKNVK